MTNYPNENNGRCLRLGIEENGEPGKGEKLRITIPKIQPKWKIVFQVSQKETAIKIT